MLGVNALAGFGAGGGFIAALTLTGTETDFDLGAHLAAAHGWDGAAPAEVALTVAAGAMLRSSHTGTPALNVALPAGSRVILVNHGSIIGTGGTALSVTCPITIDNRGLIAGGATPPGSPSAT